MALISDYLPLSRWITWCTNVLLSRMERKKTYLENGDSKNIQTEFLTHPTKPRITPSCAPSGSPRIIRTKRETSLLSEFDL